MRLRLLESLTMFVVLGLVHLASPCVAQEGPSEAAQLGPGQTLEREMTGAETHAYKFDLAANEFFQVRVEQKGVDVVLKLLDSSGKVLATMDSPNFKGGPEALSWVTVVSGSYLLEVSGFDSKAEKGKYTIRREPSRPATAKDRRRVEVEQVFVAGMTARDVEGQGSIAVGKLVAAFAGWKELRDEYLAQLTAQQIGSLYDALGDKQKALEFYNQALRLERAVGDRGGEAATLNGIGKVYVDLGEKQKALAFHSQALPLFRAVGDRGGEATTLNHIGRVYVDLGEKQKALEYYNQALPLYRAVGDRGSEATTLSNIGNVYDHLGEKQKALEYYNQALPLYRAVSDRGGEATTLSNIGLVYKDLGEKQKALEYCNQALPLYRAVGDRGGEATTLNNMGAVNDDLGEKEKALAFYDQALLLYRAVGDRDGEATTLNNIGIVYDDLGEKQKALEYYNQALPLLRAVGNRGVEAMTLNNIGKVNDGLGEKQKALEFYNQALLLKRAVGDRSGEATTLNNIGIVYADLGEKQKALEYYNQALPLLRAVGNRGVEATTLNNIGIVYDGLGEKQKALEFYNRALLLYRAVGDRDGEATTLNNIGIVYDDLGEKQKALEFYSQGLPLLRAVGNRGGEATTLSNLMFLWQELGKPALAIFYGKQAINDYQLLRGNIQGLNKEIQKTYLATIERWYRFLADLLIAQRRLPEAQQVLAMLKEQEYFDFVRRDGAEANSLTARATLTSDEATLEKEYNKVADEVTRIGRLRGELFVKKERSPAEEQQLSQLENHLNVATDHFQKFLEQLQVKLSPATAQGERVNEVKDALGMQKTLRELGNGAVLLYTLVGEDKYRVMLVTPDTEQAYENPISAADLARKVLAFREALQNPRVDPAPPARELYNILIGPKLAHDLEQAKAQTLMWSLDSVLRYLPVAALQDEAGRYLVETYRSVIFTPSTRDRLKDPVTAHWQGLGLGVSKGREIVLADTTRRVTFNPLPGVRQELRSIIREQTGVNTNGGGVLDGRVLLDESFTKDSLRAALRQRYSLVHIASHFLFQPGNETDSFLLLGGADAQNNRLTIAEMKRLSFEGVDLLTLSACETAMGGEKANGVEVESFGVLAQRQGAEAVLATLWPVADVSTPVLMREFYRLRETNPGMTKVEALREAQLSLLRGALKNNGGSKAGETAGRSSAIVLGQSTAVTGMQPIKPNPNAPYSHPFYWAPFILIGNWK